MAGEEMQKGPKPAELTLSEEERKGLGTLIHRYSTPQQLAKRGRIVLAAAEGKRNAEIARELAVSIDAVRTWRGRWISLQAVPLSELSISERLEDIPRPGRPPEITAEQQCQIVALACEAPSERPISHWTGKEIAQEIMQRGIVEQISPRHAARLLYHAPMNKPICALCSPDPSWSDETQELIHSIIEKEGHE